MLKLYFIVSFISCYAGVQGNKPADKLASTVAVAGTDTMNKK